MVPTLLALLGLPKAADMPGRVVTEMLDPGRAPPPAAAEVASYDDLGLPLRHGRDVAASSMDAEMIARLQALGYVQAAGPAEGIATATYHINSGLIFLRNGDLGRAETEFLRAREKAPHFDQAHLGLAEVEIRRGRPQTALAHLEAALTDAAGAPPPDLLTRAAGVYARAGRHAEGIATLGSLVLEGRPHAFRLAAVGMLREGGGDVAGAIRDYEGSLRIDPSVLPALRGLYGMLRGGSPEDLASLASTLERSLAAEPMGVAVKAANWLALTRERQGRAGEARKALEEALAKDPQDVMTLTNLGSMLIREDRSEEGLPYLERADALRPGNLEIRVNMIVAHGKMGDLARARRLFEDASAGARPEDRPLYLNAIAYACFLNDALEDADRYLSESLRLAPDHPEARRLQVAIRERDRG